jgi:signal peptidase I
MVLWVSTGVWSYRGGSWPVIACGMVAFLLSLGLLASALLGRRFVAVAVRGQSMEPTLHDGDWLLVRRGRDPARGQVIVIEHPASPNVWLPNGVPAALTMPENRWLVKRVAAVPGDPVPRDRVPSLADVSELEVPTGKLVLLGDNRQSSFDSSRLGYFSTDKMLGAVVRQLAIGRHRSKPAR